MPELLGAEQTGFSKKKDFYLIRMVAVHRTWVKIAKLWSLVPYFETVNNMSNVYTPKISVFYRCTI